MDILLFGVSNVGKTTIGKIIASKLGYNFYDIDDEVKIQLHITLEEFTGSGSLEERDKVRCKILRKLLNVNDNKVIAVSPISFHQYFDKLLDKESVFAVELFDKPENIFERLVFSDENDSVYTDNDYKELHKKEYLRDIQEDLNWYRRCNMKIKNRFDIDGRTAKTAASDIIRQFGFKKERLNPIQKIKSLI